MCRFVNIVEKSNLTEKEIWKNIKYLQFERRKRKSLASQEECFSIKCKVAKLSPFVGMKNISDEVIEEFPKSTTKSPFEMFLTLIEPPYFERLYSKAIYGPQSRVMLLALNIVNTSPQNFQLKAKRIFSKMASVIFTKYHNESITNRKDISVFEGKLNQPKIYLLILKNRR